MMDEEELILKQEDEEGPIKAEATEAQSSFQAKLLQRCSIAKIDYEKKSYSDYSEYFLLKMPSGRDRRSTLVSASEIENFLDIPFEKYVFLSGYEAICSYQDGVIEALIGSFRLGSRPIERIFGRPFNGSGEERKNLELKLSNENDSISIRIGSPSQALSMLSSHRTTSFSLSISGLNVSQHDQAINYLIKISNTIFFEADLLFRVPLSLLRERSPLLRGRAIPSRGDSHGLQFPRNEYDDAPMALYWYARSANGMPLLQFLAYYQVVEFYFPRYAQIEAQRRVQNILKNPTFNPYNTTDIGKLLTVIQPGPRRGYGDELTQLRATVSECLEPRDLWEFLIEDEGRKDALSKGKLLPKHRLPLTDKYADVREQVSSRVYEIRCKIVHTKNENSDTELDLLLPFSKEAELLGYDIDLMNYIAQQVLIASSRQLRV